MSSAEKNYKGEDAVSMLLRHTEDYNLYVSQSHPSNLALQSGNQLRQSLDSRHVTMIAIGGALGTGLLIGTGSALKAAGPGAILVAYSVIGFCVFMVMSGLGEVATFVPLNGFANYCQRYVDDALGFACGYVYLFKYLILPANQLVAGSLTMQFWVDRDKINPGVWITIFLVVILAINLLGVRFFGEIEFWLSCLKVLTCLGVIILLLCITLGGSPTHDRIGFRYWNNPGAFLHFKDGSKDLFIGGSKGRFVAFVSVLVTAVFAFLGTELVGITFAETRNPRRSIPKAIKLTFYRIVVFYILSILLLGMCVSPTDKLLLSASGSDASASPFVIAIKNAKIPGLDHVINACILLFVLSAANSDMYVCSRTVYSLAVAGYAPKLFAVTNRLGVPYYGIALSFAFTLLAYMTVSSGSAEVFTYFVNVVSLTGLLAWSCILVIHIRFMQACKAQGIDRKKDLAYCSPLQPYGSYFALSICIIVVFIKNFTVFLGNSFTYKNFITGYIVLPVFIAMYFGYKFWHKTKLLSPEEVDLVTYRDVIDAEAERYEAEDAERKAVREASGNRFDKEWYYDKFLGCDPDQIYLQNLLAVEKHYLNGLKKPEHELRVPDESHDLSELIDAEWEEVNAWDRKVQKMKPSKRLNLIPQITDNDYSEIKYIVGVLYRLSRFPDYKMVEYKSETLKDLDPEQKILLEMNLFDILQSSEREKVFRHPYLLYSYINIYKFIRLICSSHLQPFITPDAVRSILGKNLSNAFGIWSNVASETEDKEYFGFGVYPSASYFNHSCAPGLKKARDHNRLNFRTIRDIKEGEELCIDYGNYLDEDVHKRRKELSEWFFDCGCEKCVYQLQECL
ncbi:uncharacterized protein CANTADRAFT_7864 [Suhomyces tanzawaensis NRRL Y-17324]|uniref:SET domain-containing protein n=1 Tax=Suhomyces tanzawaensis NRRL Y-17324 TaxID=984487 RepID=A0A1E4SCZ9_9ASCO|nr:uncharacterized protein CANTADRAFT_7864 [Suhomyces tanzawaensis NRRL Y-17324]ODV77390.1 hypothetical protein CANTADRAFT_7864 [Suhomyces tanzawaensis NRRL Y-17324]